MKQQVDLSQHYTLPNYYNPYRLPNVDVCRVFIFQSSTWEPLEAAIRKMLEGDCPARRIRILTETGVCESMVAKCRVLLAELHEDIEVEEVGDHTHDELAFAIGYIDGIIHYHHNLKN